MCTQTLLKQWSVLSTPVQHVSSILSALRKFLWARELEECLHCSLAEDSNAIFLEECLCWLFSDSILQNLEYFQFYSNRHSGVFKCKGSL